jgi:PAS domain S-box-containing protein
MSLNFKLSHKALILVAVPLLFEVVFLVTITGLLHQLEQENLRETHARDVEAAANSLLKLLLQGGTASVLSRLSNREDFEKDYRNLSDKVNQRSLAMRELVKDNEHERSIYDRLAKVTTDLQADIAAAHDALLQNDQVQAMRGWMTVNKRMKEMFLCADQLVEEQQEIQLEKKRAAAQGRERLKIVIACGVLFNVLLAISLAIYFNRGTSRRMSMLVDNSIRLAQKLPLHPPIGGGDEIAQVDEAFHRMERALMQAMRKERAIVANAIDVICSMDADFKLTAINPACFTSWGYRPNELIGQRLISFTAKEDIDLVTAALRRVIQDAADCSFEARIRKSNGSYADTSWSANWSKEEESLFCVAHDISGRKEIERMKQDFVAMVSHDLRTPLTSVQGFLSLLSIDAYGELSASGKESLSLTEGSVTRLITLVNDLLDIEKMESGMLSLQIDGCQASEIVKRAVDAVTSLASQKAISIKSTVSDNLIVRADRDRIVQVLVNLLGNAIKFSPEGSDILIAAREVEDFVEFQVRDFGRGIPKHLAESIFDRFKQVEVADEKVKGGSGLGLAICKAIVERHGGTIGVETPDDGIIGRPAVGSQFWFRLPKATIGQMSDIKVAG